MNITNLIKLLEHTRNTLGPDTEVIFVNGHTDLAVDFDIGEEGRWRPGEYCITPYETHMHVDGLGRFGIPIIIVPRPDGKLTARGQALKQHYT